MDRSAGSAAFLASRDTILRYRTDHASAMREFAWPVLDRFNWAILTHCRNRVAPDKRIPRIEFAVLPKTISGKIRRVELRQMDAARRAAGERVSHEFFEEDL